MITAAISAAVVGLLHILGITLSMAQIAVLVVVVKILVVTGILGAGSQLYQRLKPSSAEPPAPPPPSS